MTTKCPECGEELPKVPKQFIFDLPLIGEVHIICFKMSSEYADECPCEIRDPVQEMMDNIDPLDFWRLEDDRSIALWHLVSTLKGEERIN